MTDETISSNQTESSVEPAPAIDAILPKADSLEPEFELEQELPTQETEPATVLPKEPQSTSFPNSETRPEPMPLFDFRQKAKEAKQKKIETRLSKIIYFVRQNGSITNDQIQKLLRVSDATASRYAGILITRNLLKKSGKTKSVKYDLV